MSENITPIYPLLSAKEKVFLINGEESFGAFIGGLRGNATSIQQGEGDNIFKVDHEGLRMGAEDFSSAPFSVTMTGAISASDLTVTGGTITGTLIRTASSGRRVELRTTDDVLATFDKDGNLATEMKAVLGFPGTTQISSSFARAASVQMIDVNNAVGVWHETSTGKVNFTKTTNGGSSYSAESTIATGQIGVSERILYAPDSSNFFVIYINNNNGNLQLAKSTDGGDNWTISTIDTNVPAMTHFSASLGGTDTNNLFVTWYSSNVNGGNQTIHFIKTTDGGDNWSTPVQIYTEAINDTPRRGMSMTVIDASNIWIVVTTGVVNGARTRWFSTSNGGTTWSTRGLQTYNNSAIAPQSIYAISTTEIYSTQFPTDGVTNGQDIYKSTGGDFSKVADLTVLVNQNASIYASGENEVTVLGLDNGSDFTLAISTDGGTTFATTEIQTLSFGADGLALDGISAKEMVVGFSDPGSDFLMSASQGVDVIQLRNIIAPSIPPIDGIYLYAKSGEFYAMDDQGVETLNS